MVHRAADLLAEATFLQRLLARAVMNGESDEAALWRSMFPGLFDPISASGDSAEGSARARSEALLAVALEVAGRGDRVRDQIRGAIVEALTERLLSRRTGGGAVRRERRILFDGVRSEIHPYDVTVEVPGAAEAFDCKWGARGIKADVLHQLDDARVHAGDEDARLRVGLVVFDADRSCRVRLARETAPSAGTHLISLEALDRLATGEWHDRALP
ncbi:MAG: hypothetical protein AABZ33_13100 [Chloroflexota bacterium]